MAEVSMKKILLISCPDIIHGMDNLCTLPNLGLEKIAGCIKDIANVKILDLKLSKKKVSETVKEVIDNFNPNIVGISCMTFQYPTALKIANLIKKINPKIKIVFGGYHPTLCIDDVLKEAAVDYVVRVEGEPAFRELAVGKKINKIKGLSYKQNGKLINNPSRPLVKNLDSLPFPYRKARIFKKGYDILGRPGETLETSRGCIRIFIIDDNITLDMDRIGKLCDAIINNGLNDIRYIVQASSIGIGKRRDVVKKMSEAGFEIVFLGIENINKKALRQLGKGDIMNYSKLAIQNLRDFNILVAGGFIVGNPEDDEESIFKNVEFALTQGIDFPIFFISTPYPRTKWGEELDKMGLITNKTDFSKYTSSFANVKTKYLESDELHRITGRAYLKFYLSLFSLLRKNQGVKRPEYWIVGLRWAGVFLKLHLMKKVLGYERTLNYLSKNNVNF